MAYTEKLPEWFALGTEPPTSLKTSGYKVNDEPAPDHWNWIHARGYYVTKELQEKSAEKTALAITNQNVTDLTTRVSTVEQNKADKEPAPVWITPTLLNGWSALGNVRFTKTNKIVYVQGLLTGGSTAGGTLIFKLPEGYRPGISLVPLVFYRDPAGLKVSNLDIFTNGEIRIGGGGLTGNDQLMVLLPPFPAEL